MATTGDRLQLNPPITLTVTNAASVTTDGMQTTIQVIDRKGNAVAGVFPLEVWYSEDSGGIGLTADAYSGTLTAVASNGAILTALTAKKHVSAVTNAAGTLKLLVVDSANPTDQYVAVKRPYGAGVIVSTASGTNWEGA